MISKVSFSNYKAFKNAEINICPITILLGPNSIGKSSVMQLLLLLQQTSGGDRYRSSLRLNGAYISLGEGINLFRKRDDKKILKFSYNLSEYSILNKYIERHLTSFINSYIDIFYAIYKMGDKNTDLFKEFTIEDRYSIHYSKWFKFENINYKENFKEIFKLGFEYLSEFDASMKKDIYYKIWQTSSDVVNLITNLSKENQQRTIDLFLFAYRWLNESEEYSYQIEYQFRYIENSVVLDQYDIIYNEKSFIRLKIYNEQGQKKVQLYSDFIDLEDINTLHKDSLDRLYQGSRTIFSFTTSIDHVNYDSIYIYFFKELIEICNKAVQQEFTDEKIAHISPLRAQPQRYYFLDKFKENQIVNDASEGDVVIDILNSNSYVLNKVNDWFKNFNLKIRIDKIKDTINTLQVIQNEIDLNITDVGFGVSQILPIISQCYLSQSNSLSLIEQPEIHLHPKMQADLADLFIDAVTDKRGIPNRQIIIETHSEYFLKRIRRRIAEKKILSKDVAIYLFEENQNNEKDTLVRRLEISETGSFEWPKNFYCGDILDDTIEFLKNQG